MSEKSSLDDLTIEQLERLLKSKRRARASERFRRLKGGEVREAASTSSVGDGATVSSAESADRRRPRPQSEARAPGPPSSGAASVQDGTSIEGSAFETVRISPETSSLKRIGSFLGRVNRGFWLRGFPRLRDRLLLLLELAALAGLIFVVFSSLSNLRLLNREVAEALESGQAATPAPTAAAVLPGGSLPPGSEGTVPNPYRHLVEPGASIPIPTPGPRQASRIVIRAIDVDAPVVEGDGWEELKMGTGHRIGSANPGERGNMVISGHNDVFGEIFRHLEDLKIGDEVVVYAGDTPHRYSVVATMVVEPTEVSLMEPTPNATLTLITCHPYMIDSHRFVVIAELANQ
ncbi:MAG: sortase [Anaerolineae bacterium]|nr:sortase [Anaerolineae bacterium]NIN93821.1 sortase [Anaerolineae bacterium]NIQ76856.1 sortase [Anaerolineae bacterium]